ncbi:Sm-like protein LSm1 [Wickerhamomyces ciferrii]|uniref:Sm-like protein LSm1 n=1 Tax=Wickerhamomyces ciferrii (strain ATCC 14091 / BCRC 22168 / CBS 111 / JCM 3599 / NBRC 0793 / NRRL Y-1031 F-60-10) TaxID=1206466 RepID=K0KJ03_WICCF|nr:Sm-like protein LSm1 [Wickerhamomyces ciferrii]CCH45205.1 Sm-like protein LSm1 [Wickerhamomyces ciferrii]
MSGSPTPEASEKSKSATDQLSENVAELYLESFSFTTAAAIIGYVDRKVCVTLTDGRHLFGVLRTFDQYGKIYLSDNRYGEEYVGVLLIRGENIVIIGDVDIDKEDEPLSRLTRIPFPDAKQLQKQSQDQALVDGKKKTKKLHKQGLVNDHVSVF